MSVEKDFQPTLPFTHAFTAMEFLANSTNSRGRKRSLKSLWRKAVQFHLKSEFFYNSRIHGVNLALGTKNISLDVLGSLFPLSSLRKGRESKEEPELQELGKELKN